jgi:hypothetical protein
MGFVRGLVKVAAGAAAGVTVVTALPIFGAVGAITAAGLVVGSVLGAAAGVADEVLEARKDHGGIAQRAANRRSRSS